MVNKKYPRVRMESGSSNEFNRIKSVLFSILLLIIIFSAMIVFVDYLRTTGRVSIDIKIESPSGEERWNMGWVVLFIIFSVILTKAVYYIWTLATRKRSAFRRKSK